MDDGLRPLQERVRAHQAGRAAPAIRYPEALRREIVARLEGVREGRVEVAAPTPPTAPASAPVLVTPHGVRVEGPGW